MDRRLFAEFARIAYHSAGIHLGRGKEALVDARVARRVRALGFDGAEQYLAYLTQDASGDELVHFLDAIATNVTSFFREPLHFELLAELVRRRVGSGQKRLRLWSAAASSGEEPYSMALVLREALADGSADPLILATDISTRILARARHGRYPASSLRAVPERLRAHFAPVAAPGSREPLYQVDDGLRALVVFRRLNLAAPPFPMRGPLDAVFCRNVMIYFDRRVRQALVAEIERLLTPGGLLFIGQAESLTGLDTRLRALRPSVYALEGARDRAERSSSTPPTDRSAS